MIENNQELELNIADYLKIVWRHKWAILLITVITTAIIFLPTLNKKPVYESSALVSPAKLQDQNVENIEKTMIILQQETTLRELASNLELTSENTSLLRNQFNALAKENLLEIKGLGPTPEEAKKITDTISTFIVNRQNSILNIREKLIQEKNGEMLKEEEQMLKEEEQMLKEEIALLKEQLKKNELLIKEFENKVENFQKIDNQYLGQIFTAYLNNLTTFRLREDGLRDSIYEKNLKLNLQKLDPLESKLEKLNLEAQKSSLISPSYLPTKPIPANEKNTLLIGILLGLFVGIFYSFIIESFRKNRKKV